MPQIFVLPRQTALDDDANPLAGALCYFYQTGTTTPQAVYSDVELTTPHSNPVVADSGGRFQKIYLDSGASFDYRARVESADGTLLYQEDGIDRFSVSTEEIVGLLYPRSQAEIDASVTPFDTSKAYGEVLRQGANTTPGTTNVAAHIQAAVDAADDIHAEVYLRDDNALTAPILIRESTTSNVSFVGNGRVSTILRPTAASIATAPQSVNALFINQKNNGHVHFRHLRCLDAAAYTGFFLYCTEGGASDGSADALFSTVVDDCWFSFATTNSGIFKGGFSNLMVTNSVFEGTKTGCFIIEGAGNGDQMFVGNVMNACYDMFLYGSLDTQTKANVTVDTLHVYQHFRGPVIDMTNGTGLKFVNIHMQPDAANVGTTGLLKLTDCTDVQATNLTAKTRAGVPAAACAIDIITTDGNESNGTFTNIISDATVGIRVSGPASGSGTIDLTFANCDFSGCEYGFQYLSGILAGRIRFLNCKINNSLKYGFIHSAGTSSINIDIVDCEIINAGMDGTATARNLDINTAGNVRIIDTSIGKTSLDADATHFIRAEGSGTFKVVFPTIIGTPPTSLTTGAQTISFVYEPSVTAKTFTATAAASTVVADTEVQANSHIVVTATNIAGANLMAGAKTFYVSARNAGVSFTLSTADGTSAAGTENFTYRVLA